MSTAETPINLKTALHRSLHPFGQAFNLSTSQEMRAFSRAIAEGCHDMRHWKVGAISLQRQIKQYTITIPNSRPEEQEILRRASLDHALVIQYVVSRLVSIGGKNPADMQHAFFIEEIARAIFPSYGSKMTREQKRQSDALVWDALRLADAAVIVGARSKGTYQPILGKSRPTFDGAAMSRVESPILHLGATEYMEKRNGGRRKADPAHMVTILLDPAVGRVLVHSPQFIAGGELLGQIPGKKPSGAMARSIGWAALDYWRQRKYRFVRSNILETFPPATVDVSVLLQTDDRVRVRKMFNEAIYDLELRGFLEKQAPAPDEKAPVLEWYRGSIDLRPGPILRDSIDYP